MDEWKTLLGLSSPWMNAAGFGGFLPHPEGGESLRMGAFVTNPVSLQPRSPAQNRILFPYAGGFLMHTGHPNPGLKAVLKTYAAKWKNQPLPVIVHLLVTSAFDCQQMVQELEGVENVAGIELGLPPHAGGKEQLEMIRAALGELPVWVCQPLDQLDFSRIEKMGDLGVAGVVIGAPRGSLVNAGRLVQGRLFGPALHPQLLAAICRLRNSGLPILAGCGIFSQTQGEEALKAGAAALQTDGWCWQF